MRLVLTFPDGSKSVTGSEVYVIPHLSPLLHYGYKSLRVSLLGRGGGAGEGRGGKTGLY